MGASSEDIGVGLICFLYFCPIEQTDYTIMSTPISDKIFSILKGIQGAGSFQVSGQARFLPPGLAVKGIGELSFPLSDAQAGTLIKLAKKAAFGKGAKTITDTRVRSVWEIDATQVSFQNPDWAGFMDKVLGKAKKGLGIEKREVAANLYKLLIYEPGDFFLPHKDSEKEKGMFGTLVVGLPSEFSGGELVLRFEGATKTIDFAAAGNYKIPFAAFYADCEHEIKPVKQGYRIALVYNLVQSDQQKQPISSPRFQTQGEALAGLLRAKETLAADAPFAVLLGHQYTPANFSRSALKLHDRPRAEALLAAAEAAGYFGALGLVTHYLSGELVVEYQPRSRRRYNYDDEYGGDPENGTMGEVFDQRTSVEHWDAKNDVPGLGNWPLEEHHIMAELSMGEGDPIEKEAEGYTGNAGMTLDYWYHYGAVLLWPKNRHTEVLGNCTYNVRLEWLDYYLRQTGKDRSEAEKMAEKIMSGMLKDLGTGEDAHQTLSDASPLALALARFIDRPGFLKKALPALTELFLKISSEAWLTLLQATADPGSIAEVFAKAGKLNSLSVTHHLADVLLVAYQSKKDKVRQFALAQAEHLADYLECLDDSAQANDQKFLWQVKSGHDSVSRSISLIEKTLAFSVPFQGRKKWEKSAAEAISRPLNHLYAQKIYALPLLNAQTPDTDLKKALRKIGIGYLEKATAEQPQPPKDWSRPVPEAKYHEKSWKLLTPFLTSPTEQHFDYRQVQALRSEMESAISNVTIDLRTETIKTGSPHTLRLIKTQAAYERELKRWKDDCKLLKLLKGK